MESGASSSELNRRGFLKGIGAAAALILGVDKTQATLPPGGGDTKKAEEDQIPHELERIAEEFDQFIHRYVSEIRGILEKEFSEDGMRAVIKRLGTNVIGKAQAQGRDVRQIIVDTFPDNDQDALVGALRFVFGPGGYWSVDGMRKCIVEVTGKISKFAAAELLEAKARG